MLLTVVDCRLRECDLIPKATEILVDAAVVRRCAIPIGGRQAGTEHEDFHWLNSSHISSNCRARCWQVCFSRMVSNAWRDNCCRAALSRSKCEISPVMARPSGTHTKS